MGRRPLNDGPIFSEVPPRRHAVLDTTPLNHTYRLHFLIPGHLLEFRDNLYLREREAGERAEDVALHELLRYIKHEIFSRRRVHT